MSELSTPANLSSAPVHGARVPLGVWRWFERLGGGLFDHPSIVTGSFILMVIAQFVVASWFPLAAVTAPFDHLDAERREIAVSALSLGVAGVAAMVGGFAGMVVLFGLSSIDDTLSHDTPTGCAGELVVVRGASGAGKSTLLRTTRGT